MAVLFWLMNFSSAHAQARLDRRAYPNKVLASEQMRAPRWLRDPILQAARATNTDPAVLIDLADNDPPSRNAKTSSPQGPFQFVEGTWFDVLRRYGHKHGYGAEAKAIHVVRARLVVSTNAERERILNLRRDPYLSALMTGEMLATHRQIAAGKLAPDPGFAELYMAYVLGVNGARRFAELLRDGPGPSEGMAVRGRGPRVSSRANEER